MINSPQNLSESGFSKFDYIEKAIQIQSLKFDRYLQEEIFVRVDWIGDQSNRLSKIDEIQCRALAESFRDYTWDYASDMMTVYSFSNTNHKDATYATALHNANAFRFSERRLLHSFAQLTALVLVCWNMKRLSWSEIGYRTTAHSLRISGWQEGPSGSFGDKIEQND